MKTHNRPAALWALLALVGLEAAAMTALVVLLAVDLVAAPAADAASGVALVVTAAIGAALVIASVVGLARGQAWARSATLVWQVLLFAVGLGALGGAFAQPAWGWPLILVAVAAVVLLFLRPVAAATSARRER